MKRVFWLVRQIEEIFPALLIGTLTLMVAIDVLGRYFFNHPIKWFGELATVMFIWQVFIGSSAALRRRLHVSVDIFVIKLPNRAQALISMVVHLAILVMSVAVIIMGWNYAFQAKTQRIQTLDLPYTVALLAVPMSGFFMCFHLIHNFTKAVRGFLSDKYESIHGNFGELCTLRDENTNEEGAR
ncbi:MAG: TRAP transporter small permease [Candidatus Methanomethylicaceae archaeon]